VLARKVNPDLAAAPEFPVRHLNTKTINDLAGSHGIEKNVAGILWTLCDMPTKCKGFVRIISND